MRNSIVFAGFALALSIPVSAPVHAGGEPGATGKDKMVCKYSQKTGTRFKKPTCRTAAQWDLMAQENQRAVKEMVDRPQVKVCGPSGCD